ncbi:MAG: hypothetical protein NTU62_17295 [Spirochaetes bacterium]|nr:hypothetical protein [Spirochaetota bacterium]
MSEPGVQWEGGVFHPGPAVDLIASSTWIETGETSTLTANAYDPEGDTLSYEWYENGSRIVGETDSTLNYWRAVEETEYVTVKVVVRDGRGGYGTDSVDITVDPIYDAVVLVINHSSDDVWFFRDNKYPYIKWSNDRLGAHIIPAGSSYLVMNNDLYGYAGYWWNLRAIPEGGDPVNPTITWQQDDVFLSPYEVYEFVLTD